MPQPQIVVGVTADRPWSAGLERLELYGVTGLLGILVAATDLISQVEGAQLRRQQSFMSCDHSLLLDIAAY